MAVEGQRFMTKTQHYRKVTKPLLERKRRARMNLYFDELKDLIVDTMEAQGEHIAKLEKADILELTVNYLKMQKHDHHLTNEANTDKDLKGNGSLHMEKFRAGYTQAAYDVSKAFASLPGLDIKFATRLMQHLGWQLKGLKGNLIDPNRASTSTVTAASTAGKEYHTMDYKMSPHPSGINHYDQFQCEAKPQVKHEDVWRPW